MKKTYQNPEIKIVKVQMAQMIANSNPQGFAGALGSSDDGGDGSAALGRRGDSLWGDDEE